MAGGVILELAIAKAPAADVIRPDTGIDHAAIELIRPHDTTIDVGNLRLDGGVGWIALTIGRQRDDRHEIGHA